jgi:hypothetical protein
MAHAQASSLAVASVDRLHILIAATGAKRTLFIAGVLPVAANASGEWLATFASVRKRGR